MSRTKKGSKGAGAEYWGKRPNSGCVPGPNTKRLTHQKERAIAAQELLKEVLNVRKGKNGRG